MSGEGSWFPGDDLAELEGLTVERFGWLFLLGFALLLGLVAALVYYATVRS